MSKYTAEHPQHPAPKHSGLGELHTIAQTAQRLECSPNTVRALIRKGELVAVRIGPRMVRVREADLEKVLQPYEPGQAGTWGHLQ